ncbi:MAG: hypothetical protein AAF710_08325 [Planctomycetota bacterium]
MTRRGLPYTPHPLARWSWIIWPLLILICLESLITWFGSLIAGQPFRNRGENALEVVRFIAIMGFCAWYAWCQPLIWAYDPSSQIQVTNGKVSPSRIKKILNYSPLSGLFFAGISVVVMGIAVVVDFGSPQWTADLTGFCVALIALPVAYRITKHVRRTTRREFPRRLALLGVCSGCGYNLCGISGPVCPECGRPLDPEVPVEPPPPSL